MIAEIKFDLDKEEDRLQYAKYISMGRNAEFWEGIYCAVFRNKIKYDTDGLGSTYEKVWEDVASYMEALRFESD